MLKEPKQTYIGTDQVIQRQRVLEHLDSLRVTPPLSQERKSLLRKEIKRVIKKKNAVLIAHYYVDEDLQKLSEETGGFVGDSLEMARFGKNHPADILIIAGVKFMGETAQILSPDKTVLMPTLDATCSLDLGCPAEEFNAFCEEHPDRTVIVYANTSAAVKARADWVATSSIAISLAEHLHDRGEKILWAPDKYLGNYIARTTGADLLCWNSACIVHEEFKAQGIKRLLNVYPRAAVLVHPESPPSVIEMADRVGSTSQLIAAVNELPNDTFIVATDRGIFYKMRQQAPNKQLIAAPTAGKGATCRSCAHCPWMAMNDLERLAQSIREETNRIHVPEALAKKAIQPLQRMLRFRQKYH